MNIEIIENQQTWDSFIQKQRYSSFFLSWNWGKFEKNLGNIFENYGMFDGGTLVGVLPIKIVSAKRGKFLHLRHGPVINWENSDTFKEVLNFLKEKAKKEKAWVIRISPLIKKESEVEKLLYENEFVDCAVHGNDAELAWILPLDKSEEELLKGTRKTTRYEIKKALKERIEIIKTTDPKMIDQFWEIYQDTVKRQKWSAYTKNYIKTQFETFTKDNQILLFLAKHKNEFISGGIFIYFAGQSFYQHGASLTKYRNLPSAHLLQWEAILEAKQRGMKIHNFWGIVPKDKKNHPWAGLSLFKRGFGGEEQEFTHAKDLMINWRYLLTRTYEKIERRRRGY